ncbi:MAG: hypothetical protein IJW92_09430 [Clostridia bacterium]|nr:hypothetical protein [Clostridia bacterium]
MKKIKTRRFLKALYTSLGFSAVFLLWFALFGRNLAIEHFDSMAVCVFAVLALATLSFLAVCFVPYFHGDKRWYVIPSLLTLVFFAGTVILWQVPVNGVVL